MEKKQLSAVEWLVSKMPTAFKELAINKELIQQALEMEREQKAEIIKNIRSYGK